MVRVHSRRNSSSDFSMAIAVVIYRIQPVE
jgi:hypothetical protein